MSSTWLIVAAVALGVCVGVGFMVMISIAESRGRAAARLTDPEIPSGVDDMLGAFDTAGLVLDPSNNVLRATEAAIELGMLTPKGTARSEVIDFVAAARRSEEAGFDRDVFFDVDAFGASPRRVTLSAAQIGARYLVVLARDRSEEDRLEAVRRDFIANLSHELKTPTASVRLIAEAMERAAEDPATVRRFANRLGFEAERMSDITAEVIELSRLQAESAAQTDGVVNLEKLVSAAIKEHRVLAADKKVKVVSSVEPDLQLRGDAKALRTALSNLISNAIAYSDEGGRVGVGVSERDDMIEIAVTDRGIGMDPSELDRIFERFYRVDQARSRNTGGTGLGLSIVKHIAANHGGHVRAWSQPGKGSTFTIRLPRGDA